MKGINEVSKYGGFGFLRHWWPANKLKGVVKVTNILLAGISPV